MYDGMSTLKMKSEEVVRPQIERVFFKFSVQNAKLTTTFDKTILKQTKRNPSRNFRPGQLTAKVYCGNGIQKFC